ncbi:MAG: DUF6527 family protein [Nitrospiraceae bacterium]
MPKELQPGILYVAEEYGAAAHLCACGCGMKVRTPITPNRWVLTVSSHGPSLWPSVGNWQQPCKSHYVIKDGSIVWCDTWTPEQVSAGREREKAKRQFYYDELYASRSWNVRLWAWVKSWFGE